MSVQQRNNVHCHGDGEHTMMFVHGYGCDQSMWRFIHPAYSRRYKIVLLDLTGSGGSDLSAYDRDKYADLHGHAQDILEIIELYAKGKVIFVGHSVSAMIGLLASIQRPERFAAQVMIGPSPSFINDGDYVGGFNAEDVDQLLKMIDENYLDWSRQMVPAIMGAPNQPHLTRELLTRFERNDQDIARHFARVTFTADHRADLARSTIPSLVLQCSDDLLAPREVGIYLREHLPNSVVKMVSNVGHCPHLSAPEDSSAYIDAFLSRNGY
ncbi:sigma factor sigB regulation protein rsbQ [Duganella sp. Leaf126]|uniref:alpha/beta fold hydrolase n=1 Tax=Duganella sp. Leaf126 TaxID=1736266 RepID=UPI0006F3A6AC|nr:alpha/beta hydrolase [Duganella sp. Leaf126]KQQ45069.1 sigma factor sigB regulation protein rsbQ [Duganella sp. Leaf126]